MHKNITIFNELKELGSTLANMPVVNVFSVPDGYFESIVPSVLLQINQFAPNPDMEVPAGYFDGLAGNIMNRIRGEENETGELPPILQSVQHINVFSIPQGYFDSLSGSIANTIENSESELLLSIPKQNVFSVPNGYFDRIAGAVIDKVQSESNVLASIQTTNVFTVPQGYFDNFAGSVMSRISAPAKVVSMGKRTSVFKYAAAAVITGIIGFSVFTFFNKDGGNKFANDPVVMAEAQKILQNNSFDQGIESIGEDDIVRFLESNGQDVNAALVASVTDDNNLPAADDYMFDDQTLDNFLNDLNISQSNPKSN